jgi:hypothetical protein
MKILLISAYLFLISSEQPVFSQAVSYNVSLIPTALKAHANAVIRNEETVIDIHHPDEVWITCKRAITVLNPRGKPFGAIEVDYNKSRPVHFISGALYNADGDLMHKFKKSDFEDVSTIQDFSLFEDNRVKRLFPQMSRYPYTVTYQYVQKYKFTLYLPEWRPFIADGISVQQSSFSVSSPANIPVRYYGLNVDDPVIDSSDKKVHYTWRLKGVPAFHSEPYHLPFFRSGIPVVIVSPGRFEYYGMKGSFYDWKGYGKWVYEHLLAGRDELPESTVSYIHQLIKDISSPVEKARQIYAYAQQRNRYVSIQIGKGGFEPMSASEVDHVGYGDCKALVNYMMALLKVAGIPAYYTEVCAGDGHISLLPGFASAGQGNHIILCVPFKKDTVWLECTNKYIPFGYLGSFTDDRNVLVCTPQGGVFTRTPSYPDSVNLRWRTAHLSIDSTGNLRGKMQTRFSGLQYEERQPLEHLSDADRARYIRSAYSFLQMNLSDFRLTFIKDRLPVAEEGISFTSDRYAAVSEKGLSIPLNPVDRFHHIPRMIANRQSEIYIARGYKTTDSLTYIFPSGYHLWLVPREVHIRTAFGNYDADIKAQGQELTYIRRFHLHSGDYPADGYAAFVQFLQQVSEYDTRNFIIIRE